MKVQSVALCYFLLFKKMTKFSVSKAGSTEMPPKVIKIFETVGDDFFLISFLAIDTQKYGPIFLT